MDTSQDLTPAADARAIHAFVTGYLRARRQSATAQVTRFASGITVRYGPGMDREAEHFVWAADWEALAPSEGDWLTLFGDGALAAAPTGLALRPLASECFMAADLAALCRQLDGADGQFTTAPAHESPTPDTAVFRHEAQGQTVASVCCAAVPNGDALLDRLATDSAHRGRGMARSLMRAAAAWALAHGCERLLLIASPEGLPLYRRLGFQTLCAVHVFTLERSSHAR